MKFHLNTLLFAILCIGLAVNCGSGGNSLSGVSGGGGSSSSTTSDALFDSGPVDIPVNIAKAYKAPNAANISATVGSSTISITGSAGAMPEPTVATQVYIFDASTSTATTASVNSDGSFSEQTITGTGPLAIAAFDGTDIGTPIFFKKNSDSSFSWFLTNGGAVQEVASENAGEVAVSRTGELSTSDSLIKNSSTTTSTIHTLNIAGVSAEKGTVPCEVDHLYNFKSLETIVAECDGIFYYYTTTSGSFTATCGVPSGETLADAFVMTDADNNVYAIYRTDAGLYSCTASDGSRTTIHTLSSGESYRVVYPYLNTNQSNRLEIGYSTAVTSNGSTTVTFNVADTSGSSITSGSSTQGGMQINFVGTTSNESTGRSISINKIVFSEAQGSSSGFYDSYIPNTTDASCSQGTDSVEAYSIGSTDGQTTTNYLLDATLTLGLNQNTQQTELCDARSTRTVSDIQVHSSAKLVCFCQDGDVRVYCPNQIPNSGTPDGSELIDLASDATDSCSGGKMLCNDNIVFVSKSGDYTEIEIVIPTIDPRTSACFD